jgi:molybdopterin molybdotransferase
MLPYTEALEKVLSYSEPPAKERLTLDQLNGHVLAEPLRCPFDLPSFDNSAVDGYGVLCSDLEKAGPENPVQLELLGEIRAGAAQQIESKAGAAIKILTGAPVPPNTEAVVMQEFCEERNGFLFVHSAVNPGENIRRRGSEVKAGDEILHPGQMITPPVIGLIATLGLPEARVYAKPTVGLVVTGDELVAPGSELKPGQIFDSNSYALLAALRSLGIEHCSRYHARDDKDQTRKAFEDALAVSDIVISSGGVSVGDHDYVKAAVEALGVETIFWQVAIKPGKPVYFGVLTTDKGQRKLIFGLPGNPVSVLVTYHQFVKPAIQKMMGTTPTSRTLIAKISSNLRKKAGRLDFVRAQLSISSEGMITANPVRGQESHMLSGLAAADCLLHFAAEAEEIAAGSAILAQMISWYGE